MKQKKNLVAFLLITSVILMSMSSGHYEESDDGKAGHNGSPGELTCAKSTCHTTYTLNSGPGSVSISAPGMTNWQYTPGQSYSISVTIAQASMPLFGFGFEALLASGANAGTLTAGTGSHTLNATVSGNSRKTVTHLLDAGLTTGSHTFTFTWVAPASGVPVTFYAAGNAANDNGTKLGDYIYTTSQAVTAIIVPTAPTIVAAGELNLCNGATVNLSVTAQSGVTFTWFDANNAQVGTGATFVASQTGCYHVTADASGGNATSTNTICITAGSPDATFSGLENEYCSDDTNVPLAFMTDGGQLSGPGAIGTSFSPQAAGAGSHTITYQVNDVNGCSATHSQTVLVNESVSPQFTVSDADVCLNADAVQLIPVTLGGIFSGSGVNGDSFDPSIGVGDYSIIYELGEGSCLTTFESMITVLPLPDPSFSGLSDEYCSNADQIILQPTNVNGVFSGSGITNNIFDPAAAGTGVHEISLVVVDANNCSSSSSQSVEIHQEVNPFFALMDNVHCENDEPAFFMAMNPGGVYSINGEAVQNFDPAIGAGVHTVQYTVGEGSCEVSSIIDVTVLAIEDPSFTGLEAGYCSLADDVQLIPTTPGGTFSGSGINVDSFTPATALIGENVITYSLIAENGCNSSSIVTVLVYENANSDFSGLESNYCENEELSVLLPVSAGGTFTGVGMVDGTFDPTIAGPGTHEITYSVDFVGCSSATSLSTTVFDVAELTVSGLNVSYCLDDPSSVMVPSIETATLTGDGVFQNSFDPAVAGVGLHSVVCTNIDENNCTVQWTTEVEVIGLPSDGIMQGDVAVAAEQQGAIYQWLDCSLNNLPVDGATEQYFVPALNGFYAVNVTLNGCDVTSECLEVIVIGVEENLQSLNWNFYPNPASEKLTVTSSAPVQIKIFSLDGKCLLNDSGFLSKRSIDLSDWNNGVYEVVVSTKEKSESRTIMVNK